MKLEFGKKIGGDLIEGKKTFLFIKALEKAKGKDKIKFLRVIGIKVLKKIKLSITKIYMKNWK